MRLIQTLAVFLCGVALFAQTPIAPTAVVRATEDVERLRALVQAGAAPRIALEKAERELLAAQDEVILKQTLYGELTVEDLTSDQAEQMISAAQRQFDRQQQRLDDAKKLVEEGVSPRTSLTPFLEDLDSHRRTLDLALGRSRLLDELAIMARAEEEQMEQEDLSPQGPWRAMERYLGDGIFNDVDFRVLAVAFEKRFLKSLPVSARGMTATHRRLGFDHRGRVDVALNPDQPEGVWLRKYLETNRIPYYAFRTAIAGKATAAHIHLGPPSLRLRLAD